jgi:PAS domain S-box-containing protein
VTRPLSPRQKWARGGYLGTVIVIGGVILATSSAELMRDPPGAVWGILLALTAVSGWSAVRMPGFAISASLADAFAVASVLLFGPGAGAVTAACDGLLGTLRLPADQRTYERILFNLAAPAVAIWIAARLFVVPDAALAGNLWASAASLAALAIAYFVLNSTLIALAIVVGRGVSFLHVWREHMLPLGVTHVAGGYVGGALAVMSGGLPTLQMFLLTVALAVLVLLAATHALEELRRRSATIGELRIYAAALRSTVDGVVLTDPEGRVRFMNTAAEGLTGWAAADAQGRLVSDVVRLSDAGPDLAASSDREAQTRERLLVRRDGTSVPIEQTQADIEDEDGRVRGVVRTLRDVTQRKAFDAERETLLVREQEARVDAEAASRLKDDFLATLSHELRTPASAIVGWAQLLKSGRLDDKRTHKALEALDRSARAQAVVLNDLLDTSRIVRGALRLDIRRTDVGIVIGDAIDTILPSAVAKGITLNVRIDGDLPVIDADPDRLRQVFWNILSNAVKFTPDDGTVDVSARVDGSSIIVDVTDTGCGIDPAFLPYVFDRFRQADSSSGRQYGGLGLGLAIARDLVQAHGGRIAAFSEGRGRGARMSVYLPLVRRRRAGDPGDQRPQER